jgi:Tol biopolymer transport system component
VLAARATAVVAAGLAIAACCLPLESAGSAPRAIHPGRPSQIWTVDRSGHVRKLTHEPNGFVGGIAWAPGGRRIAVESNDRGFAAAVLTRHGRLLHRFRGGPLGSGEPAWSPDGRRIAFVAIHSGDEQHGDDGLLVTVSANGGGRRVIAHYATGRPDWSADGRTIYYRHGPAVLYQQTPERWDLWSIPSSGGSPRPVVPDIRDYGGLSPDRRWFTFTRREPDDLDAIWVARSDGSDQRRLLGHLLRVWFSWATGGHRVFSLDQSGQYHNAVLLSVTGKRRELKFIHGLVAWSPDGKLIAHAVYGTRYVRVETVRPDGTHRRVLARFAPDSIVQEFVWSPDGKTLAFVAVKETPD